MIDMGMLLVLYCSSLAAVGSLFPSYIANGYILLSVLSAALVFGVSLCIGVVLALAYVFLMLSHDCLIE